LFSSRLLRLEGCEAGGDQVRVHQRALAGIAGGERDQLGAFRVQVQGLQGVEDAVLAVRAKLSFKAPVGAGQGDAGQEHGALPVVGGRVRLLGEEEPVSGQM